MVGYAMDECCIGYVHDWMKCAINQRVSGRGFATIEASPVFRQANNAIHVFDLINIRLQPRRQFVALEGIY